MIKLWNVLVVLIIFFVSISVLYGYSTNKLPKIVQQSAGGFVTLSLGTVDFQSNDPTIGGKSWVLTVSQNGQGQYATGTFTSSSIKDTTTGEQATKDLIITMSMDDQTCQYPFNNPVPTFYKKAYTRSAYNKLTDWLFNSNTYISNCRNNGGTVAYGGNDYLNVIFYCIKDNMDGYYATIGDSTLNFKSTITLKAGTDTVTGTINNKDSTSVDFGTYGKGYWAGNLVTGENCPIPSSNAVAGAYTSTNWRTIDTNSYSTYKNYYDSGFDNCVQNWISYNSGTVESCISQFNSYESNALQPKAFVSSGGEQATSTGTLSTGKTTITLSKMIQYPVITLHLKADFIGIFVPVGKPKIISASSQEFQTGSTGMVTVQLQNIGTAQGSFGVSLTNCGSGISQTGTTQYLSLNANEIGTVYLPISGTTQTTLTTTCTVNAYDRNNPSNADSKSVSITVKALVICDAGKTRCNGNTIEKCVSNAWTQMQTCDYQCQQPITGDAYCVAKSTCSNYTSQVSCLTSSCQWCGNSCAETCGGIACAKEGTSLTLGQSCCPGLELKGAFLGFIGGICEKPSQWEWLISILPYIVITLIFAVGIAMVVSKKNRILGAILGALAGIMVSLVLVWITQNWIVVALGVLGGGVILYFFGGAIAFFIIMLVRAWKHGR